MIGDLSDSGISTLFLGTAVSICPESLEADDTLQYLKFKFSIYLINDKND